MAKCPKLYGKEWEEKIPKRPVMRLYDVEEDQEQEEEEDGASSSNSDAWWGEL